MPWAVAASVAASVVGSQINSALADSPTAGGGSGGGGGQSIMSQQYSYYGPHPSTSPLEGQKPGRASELNSSKAGVARAATAGELRTTPSQAIGEEQARKEFQDDWASRLSHYLDYNTRSLG